MWSAQNCFALLGTVLQQVVRFYSCTTSKLEIPYVCKTSSIYVELTPFFST